MPRTGNYEVKTQRDDGGTLCSGNLRLPRREAPGGAGNRGRGEAGNRRSDARHVADTVF